MESPTTTTSQPSTRAPSPAYEQCEQCGTPVESSQRYCVACGTKRRHVSDPAAQYLAKAKSATRRRTAAPDRPRTTRRANRSLGLGTALVLAVIPLAVGLGVVIGRSSNNGDDKLIAALKAQKPEIIQTSGGGGSGNAASASTPTSSSSSSAAVVSLSSDFPLQSGYSVELQTLPGHGTTATSVSKAKSAATGKGAKQVGVIVQSDFKVTPAPPSGAYVLYSGAYKTQAQAQQALTKLKAKFASAVVIKVDSANGTVAGAGKTLTKTRYGTAHQIAGFKPTQAQVNQGSQAVSKIQSQAGKNYVNSQRGLPDVIVVK